MKNVMLVLALMLTGCSGLKNTSSGGSGGTGGTVQNATVSGPYSAVATSTKNNGTTSVYANLVTQSSTSFSATQNTLVCPGNAPLNCTGDDPPTLAYTLTGTVSGNNVQITLQFDNANGADTATLAGTVNGTNMSGTYTDTQGDAGTWTATQNNSLSGSFSGSVNSTPNPLQIAPTITALITEGQNYALTGSATVSNSPCFVTLDFSGGTAIGGAFTLNDTTKNVFILGVPTGTKTYSVYYQVGSPAPACAGDYGTGTFTAQ
jgi:hypothetical protein